jgi:PAS domain S-box-containing protein
MAGNYESDLRFVRSMLAASEDCIKVISLDGRLTFMSEGGQKVMEISDFNAVQGCPWPDFWKDAGNREANAALAAARNGRSYRFQGAADTFLGSPRYWDVQVSPILDEHGKPEAILSVSRDISKLKEAEERSRLLALELNHRVKNTLTLVRVLVDQSLRGGGTVEEMRQTVGMRLAAMGEAHDLLLESWSKADLGAIVEQSMRSHAAPQRFRYTGPTVELYSKAAMAMAMALHELATNAAKYGALANETGTIAINWRTDDDTFVFEWIESDGPAVTAPERTGFGSRMIEQVLAGYLRGSAAVIDYEPDGLRFTLKAPMAALLPSDDEG